ncbi:GAF domain-containing protein [bacterium]|nr:GAF domain-containing protein [bacterium]MBU1598527.1 GAF domain-containing protein [bacterium]MBU2462224.1 GAF domain-containing protein [bacterium]
MDLSKRMFAIANKIRWLMIVLSILTLQLFDREKIVTLPVYIPLFILIIYNISSYFHKGISFKICYAESALDTFFISSLIFSTGGIESPFYLFYLLIIMFGACYYKVLPTFLLSFGISIIYLSICFLSGEPIATSHLMVRIPLFIATAGMCSFLVAETKIAEEELEDQRQKAKILQPKIQTTLCNINEESDRIKELYNISLKIEGASSEAEWLVFALDYVIHFLHPDFAMIFLFNPGSGKLETKATKGEDIKFPSFRIGEGLIGQVAKEGGAIVVGDTYIKTEPMYSFLKDAKVVSFIAVPLFLEGINGVLFCGWRVKRRLEERDKIFVEMIGKIISLRIKNERLDEEITRISICDKSTALFAYSFFEGKLKEELARSMRLFRPISLIILRAGKDLSLDTQRLGLIINSQTRADDMVTYQNNTFFILALRTGEDRIRILTNRIREEIEKKMGIKPTIGIACYPDSIVESHNELIKKAYAALALAERKVERMVIASECGI